MSLISNVKELSALEGNGPVSQQSLDAAVVAFSGLLSALPLDPLSEGDEPTYSTNGTPEPVSERAAVAAAMRNVVSQITAAARRTAAVPGAPPVVLISPMLNVSVQALPMATASDSWSNTSLMTPTIASVPSSTTSAALRLPASLTAQLAAGSEPPVLQMWTSNVDLYGTGSTRSRRPVGPTVSVTIFQGNGEVNVNASDPNSGIVLSSPIMTAMPVSEDTMTDLNATGTSSKAPPCVGQPSPQALFARLSDGVGTCKDALTCQFWSAEENVWSTDGCETVALADGGVGCACSHLTDFTMAAVPNQQSTIEFVQVNLDEGDELLQCSCRREVHNMLRKTATHSVPVAEQISFIQGPSDVSYRVLDVTYQGTDVAWLTVATPNGTRDLPIGVLLMADGLAELGGDGTYQANMTVEVLSESFQTRNATLQFVTTVSASVVAQHSTWGTVPAGTTCDNTSDAASSVPMHVGLGETRDVIFTACDRDRMPVAHELPTDLDRRMFGAALHRVDSASTALQRVGSPLNTLGTRMQVEAISGGLYKARVTADPNGGVGLHHLIVDLDGQLMPMPMPIVLVCPPPLMPTENNQSCACPAGTASSAVQTPPRECVACTAGKYQPAASNMPCLPSPSGGYVNDVGSTAFVPCPAESHQIRQGQERCAPCPEQTGTNGRTGAVICTSCAVGFYNAHPGLPVSVASCKPCPTAAVCTNNASITSLNVLPGRWRFSALAIRISECRMTRVNGTVISECTGGTNASSYCAPGLYGPFCRLCSNHVKPTYFGGVYLDRDTHKCRDCPSIALTLTIGALILIGVLVGTWVVFVKLKLHESTGLTMRVNGAIRVVVTAMGVRSKFKIAIGLYQVLAQLGPIMRVDMPLLYYTFLDRFNFLQLSLGALMPGACIGPFVFRLALRTIAPLVLMLFVLIGYGANAVRLESRVRASERSLTSAAKRALWSSLPIALLLSFTFFTPAVVAVFDGLRSGCDEFEGHRPGETESYLRADYSVRCSDDGHSDPEHDQILGLAWVTFFIWPVAVPVMYVMLLLMVRTALVAKRPTRVSRAVAFLHGDYRPPYFYWEALDILRRLILSACISCPRANSPELAPTLILIRRG